MATQPTNLSPVEELRELILGRERLDIQTLKDRLGQVESKFSSPEAFEHEVSQVFSGALKAASGAERQRLVTILSGLLSSSVRQEIKLAQPEFLDALYPAASQLVAEGIRASFRDLKKSIEKQIAARLSIFQALKVKAKAMMTGRSEAEIWLEVNPPFDIEQALVIHKQSGLLIASYQNQSDDELEGGGDTTHDPDLVSAMLTAIMGFAKDAMSEDSTGELTSLEFADGVLLIQSSSSVILALKVKGHPSEEFRDCFSTEFHSFVRSWSGSLATFDGELEKEEETEINVGLEALIDRLETNVERPAARSEKMRFVLLAFLFVMVVVGAFYIILDWWRDRIVDQAQETIYSTASVTGYPLTASYDDEFNLIRVIGIVPTRFVAEELRENLRRSLGGREVSFNLRVLHDELVAQTAREQTALMVTNSRGVKKLETAISLLRREIQKFDAELADGRFEDGLRKGFAEDLATMGNRIGQMERFIAEADGLRIPAVGPVQVEPDEETIPDPFTETVSVDSLSLEEINHQLLNAEEASCRDLLTEFVQAGLDNAFVQAALNTTGDQFSLSPLDFEGLARCSTFEFDRQGQLYDEAKAKKIIDALAGKAWGELGERTLEIRAYVQLYREETENRHFAERIAGDIQKRLLAKGIPAEWVKITPIIADQQRVGNGSSWRTSDFVYFGLMDKNQESE